MTDERPLKRQKLSPEASNFQNSESAGQKVDLNGKSNESGELRTHSSDQNEVDVGITSYVSPNTVPFQAILKKRYTDFLVNEILPDGQVVHLTNTFVSKRAPSPDTVSAKTGTADQSSSHEASHKEAIQGGAAGNNDSTTVSSAPPAQEPSQNSEEITQEDKQKLIHYLNETAVAELLQLYKNVLKHPHRKPKDHAEIRTAVTSDRALRTEIHEAIRRIFSHKIESTTDNDGFLRLSAANAQPRRKNQRNGNENPAHRPGKLGWMERGGEYLHFTLYKENKDTMEAISFLVRQMKVNAKVFQFAGTKDRRAVTAQRVSAYRLDAERLAAQNRHLRNAAIGDYEYQPQGLELGDLGGNEFVITLRECVFPSIQDTDSDGALDNIRSAVERALSDLHTKGFINYYGLQRFGTFNTRTDSTGLQILKGDFRAACDSIFDYNESVLVSTETTSDAATAQSSTTFNPSNDEINRAKAIRLFRTGSNTHQALELLPRKFNAENQLIRHLSRSQTDYIGALLAIPRNLRLMYVHAYQSLVWNKAASNRLNLYGDKVVEGDLVLIKEHPDPNSGNNTTAIPDTPAGDVDADGEIIIHPTTYDRSAPKEDVYDRARPLTAAEASSGSFTVFDIVLPLPGYDIVYPSNASGTFYKTFMNSAEGGGLDPHDMRRKQKDFSLSGGYRKLMARAGKSEEGLGVAVHRYAKDEEKFVQTDLERVQIARGFKRDGNGGEAVGTAGGDGTGEEGEKMEGVIADVGADADAVEGGKKDNIAVVLKFRLGSSQYATMALRELSRGGITGFKTEYGVGK